MEILSALVLYLEYFLYYLDKLTLWSAIWNFSADYLNENIYNHYAFGVGNDVPDSY